MERRELLQIAGAGLVSPLLPAQPLPKRIRVGLLGTRHSHTAGKLKAMKDSPSYEVVAGCENDAAARDRAAKNPLFDGLKWVSEDDLLGDSSLNLIVVQCNVWEALPWGAKVIKAGKHLHIEKPPGNEWQPFRNMVEEARRKQLLIQTGYLWRWHEGINAAVDAARNGWLGDVYMVRATMNADRDPEQRAVEAKYRGGGLFELAGHVIDRTVELLWRPHKVNRWLRHDTGFPDKLADNNLAVFEYEKALAVIMQAARMSGAGDHRSFEVIGTDGSFMVWAESNPPRMRVNLRKPHGKYVAGWQDVTLPPQARFVGDFKELARAIQTGQPLKHSYDHELLLHETLLRASGELS
ncbi:MAG TPA: Gfo/Idh/MocA family oxidoreductase [Bryobacteraceae bacterium]|nr:Gfo/Idh/MocA family oxidoreductase [Bryobacteraceae bacterium]